MICQTPAQSVSVQAAGSDGGCGCKQQHENQTRSWSCDPLHRFLVFTGPDPLCELSLCVSPSQVNRHKTTANECYL